MRSGRFVVAALDHPFLTPRGWVEAGDICSDDTLFSVNRSTQGNALLADTIEEIEITRDADCRCLNVQGDHTFLANDLVVHNTTFLTAWAAWLVGRNPNERIIIATHTLDYSSQIIAQTCNLMELPVYTRIFGQLTPDNLTKNEAGKWTSTQRYVRRPDYRISDPTFLAVSVGASTIGHRCTKVIADDLITQPNSMTPIMRKHIRDWFYGSLDKRIDPGGQMRIFGSRFYKDDLYGEMISSGTPHIVRTSTPENPLWPERFGPKLLKEFEDRDYFTFQAQYRMAPVDFSSEFLNENWINYYLEPPSKLSIYQGIDPSVSGKGDWAVIATIGIDENETMYVLDIVYEKTKIEDMESMILREYERWHPVLLGLEINSAQVLVSRNILAKRALPIHEIRVDDPKEIRFARMANHFRLKKVLMPGYLELGSLKPKPCVQEFLNEWRSFPMGHDDVLDAVDHSIEAALRIRVKPATVTNIDQIEMDKDILSDEYYRTNHRFVSVFH